MFKLLAKRKNCFDTIRAEELQTGDRLVFNNRAVTVIHTRGCLDKTIVIMQTTRLGSLRAFMSTNFPNEMFITIVRR